MTSLHCPATLLLARHAHAPYPPPGRSNDEARPLDRRGERQAQELGRRLAARRIAAVHASSLRRALETARIAAAELGLDVEVEPDLREFEIGTYAGAPEVGALVEAVFARWLAGDAAAACPGGETAVAVAARMQAALQGIADRYPGKTVLVVTHGGAMLLGVPLACGRPDLTPARHLGDCAVAEVEIGADGWRLRHWPGRSD